MSAEPLDLEKIGHAIKEMRNTLDTIPNGEDLKGMESKLKALDGLDHEKVTNILEFMEKQDDANQKLTLEKAAIEKDKKEHVERIETLENQVVKMTASVDAKDYKQSVEFKAFNELCRVDSPTDLKSEFAEATKTLRTDVNEFGGFLVPVTIATEILKEIEEISPVRAFSRIRTIRAKTLQIPIRQTIPTAAYEGEAEEADLSQSTYAAETMTAHRQHTIIPITRDQLSFPDFDMSSEIQEDAMTAFAQREGNRFLLGTGVKQPQGIIERSTVNGGDIVTTNISGGSVTFDSVIQLLGGLKVGYDPSYFFNRQTLVDLRVEKDSNGNYLWRQGGETLPTEINGIRYLIMQDMPDNSATNIAVGIGDFFRGYNILDALQMELVRDNFTRKREAIVEFSWNRFNDGRVVLGEAFKLLQVTA